MQRVSQLSSDNKWVSGDTDSPFYELCISPSGKITPPGSREEGGGWRVEGGGGLRVEEGGGGEVEEGVGG